MDAILVLVAIVAALIAIDAVPGGFRPTGGTF
jgi:hypothetical protein